MASAVYDEITTIIEGALKNTERILHGEPIQKKAQPKEEDLYESSGKKYVSKNGKYTMTVYAKKEEAKTPETVRVSSSKTNSSSGKSRETRKSQRVHSWGTTDYSTKKSISVVSKKAVVASPNVSDYASECGKLASSRCHSALNQIKEVPNGHKAFKSDVVFADGGLLYEIQLRGITDSLTQKGKMMINGKEYKF